MQKRNLPDSRTQPPGPGILGLTLLSILAVVGILIMDAAGLAGGAWHRIYCGPAPDPADLWLHWNLDPLVLSTLGLLALLMRRDRRGWLAVAILFVAFVSPLCALSSALFSARVVHHVLLVAVAAPLLAAAWPLRSGRGLVSAFVLSTAVLWVWHLPVAYDLALSHVAVYWGMQISLLTSAVWFWREIFATGRSPVEAMAFIVAGFSQMGLLGALLTFAPETLYAAHAVAPLQWGFNPLADQQLGGLLMWVPAGLPYAVAGVMVARRGWWDVQESWA